ncbi:MAG: PSD1 and planctomycete cytochrome C domain-containing protein [Planctomycetales bacterium]|jgi:hypothetical protein
MAVVRILFISMIAVVFSHGQCIADDYLKDVKPVLKARCYACHGALKQESDLRLDTAASIRTRTDSPIIDVKQINLSEMLVRVMSKDDDVRMPPEGEPLKPAEIDAIRKWIAIGAPAPEHEDADSDPREHWSFQRPVKADLPTGDGIATVNPIDAFITAKHRELDLQSVGPVQKSLLLRRVYLDLIGLPPTRDELRAFLADDSPGAWNRVVDRLLVSPHYGERWGRHWMDVWRYTDWYGLGAQLRNSQKHIWHWRDWIIESLNEDKGYDRMVLEMLAGDELAPTDPKTLRATGFLVRNYYLFNRTTWLDSTIEHTSKAFLGLTMNCAKCHDHKFDPLTHDDYYSMRAIFEPHQVRLDSVPGQLDLEKDGLPRVFDAHLETPTHLHLRGNEKDPDESRVMLPRVPDLLAFSDRKIEPISLPVTAHRPALRPFVLQDKLVEAAERLKTSQENVDKYSRDLAEARSDSAKEAMPGEVFLKDGFESARPDDWETGSGEWAFESGHLVQTQSGASRKYVRTTREHPQDFEATIRFRTLGGDKWKSVGLAFDVVGDREKMIYMSAVKGGSKVQVSWRTSAGQKYPGDGKQDRAVNLNQWYVLRITVRDSLINISIDEKHALAYLLPVKREPGRFDLVAFDAAVEFDSVEVRTLPKQTRLIQPGKKAEESFTPDQIKAHLAFAKAAVESEKTRPAMLKTAFAADVARYSNPPANNADELIAAAALARRNFDLAGAHVGVASAGIGIAMKDGKNPEKKLAEAVQKLAAAEKALMKPGTDYTFVRASLKGLEGPAEKPDSRNSPYPKSSTGRRTAFAKWIVDPRNPLPSRVAVNHVWLRHFGQPLVDPVEDFGRRTKAPPMQELLDWLAVDFQEKGWSMKHLHRLIVTSQAYQRSTGIREADEGTAQADATNQFYWRRLPVRMESQIVRDSVLHLAGVLDPKMGGPTENPNKANGRRRSLYFTQSRDARNAFLAMFDDADIQHCYRRSESIVPQQALAMANSRLTLEMSRLLRQGIAEQLPAGANGDAAFVRSTFELLLARQPTDDELTECQATLTQLTAALQDRSDAKTRGQAALVHALLNHNDFVTIR